MAGKNIYLALLDEFHKRYENKPKKIYISTGRGMGKGFLQQLLVEYEDVINYWNKRDEETVKEITNMVPKNDFSFAFRSPFAGMTIVNAGMFEIKDVIVNHPATIVLWEDGTKTVVKCGEDETFDLEKAIAMAFARKALGNKYDYYNIFKRWLKKDKVKNFSNKK